MEYVKNEVVEVGISDIGTGGEGIGHIDGYALFVKDALPGDKVAARITKAKKNYAYARVEKVIKPSPFRVKPACENAKRCGGCQLMEMDYAAQLKFKEDKVRNNLIRLGGFDSGFIDSIAEPIAGMEGSALRYRNKAQYPFGKNKDGEIICGFYAGRTHSIIPATECMLGDESNSEILKCILAFMKKYHIEPYDEKTGKGLVRHALLRKGFSTGEKMVCLVINGNDIPHKDELAADLGRLGVDSVSYSVNKKNTNVIMGDNYHTVYGKGVICDSMSVRNSENDFRDAYNEKSLLFNISPLSFYQVNPVQVEKLYGIAVSYAGLTGNEEVWDLCCGIGTITLSMASGARMVHGIEIVPQAIDDARKNMNNNGITNVEFICAPAEDYLQEHKKEIKADVIVMDPPRKGMDEKALEVVVNTAPERIVYVSCDSATLARDLRYLCDRGYELKKYRTCDMFPQTVHVETVVSLSLKKDSPKIEVSMKPGENSLYEPHDKGTYEKIKAYVLEKYGLKVSSLFIAQVKDKCGLDKRLNYNLSKKDDQHVPECPKEKEDAIMDAFRHFGLIE